MLDRKFEEFKCERLKDIKTGTVLKIEFNNSIVDCIRYKIIVRLGFHSLSMDCYYKVITISNRLPKVEDLLIDCDDTISLNSLVSSYEKCTICYNYFSSKIIDNFILKKRLLGTEFSCITLEDYLRAGFVFTEKDIREGCYYTELYKNDLYLYYKGLFISKNGEKYFKDFQGIPLKQVNITYNMTDFNGQISLILQRITKKDKIR